MSNKYVLIIDRGNHKVAKCFGPLDLPTSERIFALVGATMDNERFYVVNETKKFREGVLYVD